MSTYKQIADAVGVSKQLVYNICKELDPDGEHLDRSGYKTELDAWLTSAASSEAMKRKPRSTQAAEGVHEIVASNDEALAVERAAHKAIVAEKDARIADLKEERDQLRQQVADLQKLLGESQKQAEAAQAAVTRVAGASLWQRLTGFKGLLGPGGGRA